MIICRTLALFGAALLLLIPTWGCQPTGTLDDDDTTVDDDDTTVDDDDTTVDDDDTTVDDDDTTVDDDDTTVDDDDTTVDDDDSTPPPAEPPGAAEISLSPFSPTTSDELTYFILEDAVDPNNDLVGYRAIWLHNGAPRADLANATSVPATETSRDDLWQVRVTAYDATDLEGPAVTAEVTVLNTAPSVTVELSPAAATTIDDIVLTLTAADADDDTVTTTITWSLNTNPSAAHAGFNTIPAADTTRGEIWTASVTPNDGTIDGDAATATVTIANALPVVSQAEITPTDPAEGTTISLSAAAEAEADGDTVTLSYAWYVAGALVSGEDGTTLSSDHFDKAQEVYVIVTPNDGIENGATLESNRVTAVNTLPSISAVAIDPSVGTESSTFTCTPSGWTDPDPADTEGYTYQWTVDGQPSTNAASISGSAFNKHNVLQCEATPVDSDGSGTPITSGTVTIANTPPTVTSALILPSTPNESDTITVTPSGWSDDDGDSEGYQYSWTVDGSPVSSATSISGSLFDAGDHISLELTPWDGEQAGTPVTSNTVIAQNTPPVVASVSITPTTAYTTTDLTAVPAGWSDPDPADTEGYVYQWSVASSPDSAVLDDSFFAKGDVVSVTITPDDGSAQGIPVSSGTITIQNSAPSTPGVSIYPEQPEDSEELQCSISAGEESTDPDGAGDVLTYGFTWLEGGVPTAYTQDGMQDSYTLTVPSSATINDEQWTCEVTATDNDATPLSSAPGSATVTVGLPCSSLDLASGQYLSIPDSSDWDFGSGDFTVELWVYPRETRRQAIFAFQTDYRLGIDFHYAGTRNANLWASSGSGWNMLAGPEGSDVGNGQISMSLDTWHHVAYVRSGDRWMSFVDGVLDVDTTMSGSVVYRSENLNFGRWGNGAYPYNGLMDEIRISSAARYTSAGFIPSEVLPSDSDTLGRWSFREGSGTGTDDGSGGSHHASLQAGASWSNNNCPGLDEDLDGVGVWEDCDDDNSALLSVYDDGDCDGVSTLLDCDDDDPGTVGDMDCDGVATALDCDDGDFSLGAIANDPDCDGVVDCLGLDASTPASSCENALAICSNLIDDNYWLSPQGGAPFQAYCDMSTSGGGWTMVANISDAGSDVWSQFMPSQDAGLWDSTSTLGSTPTFTDDYKSQAYMDITATSLLIKEAGTNAVLRADNCWISSSFQGFISGLLWDGDASDSNWSDSSGAALCNFEHYGYNDPVLRASSHSGTQRVLAFKWGERNGVQDQNKDRAMITTYLANGYSAPHHIDFPTGLGGFTAYHANQNFEDANECQADGPNLCTNGTQNYQLFVR